jgi:hypothetical protein
LCNGKTLAFQAKDAGSIPAARSIPWKICFFNASADALGVLLGATGPFVLGIKNHAPLHKRPKPQLCAGVWVSLLIFCKYQDKASRFVPSQGRYPTFGI